MTCFKVVRRLHLNDESGSLTPAYTRSSRHARAFYRGSAPTTDSFTISLAQNNRELTTKALRGIYILRYYDNERGVCGCVRFCFPCVGCQALAFGKGDDIAFAYLKELRQNGTDRRTEMDTLISGGFLQYQMAKEAEEAEVYFLPS